MKIELPTDDVIREKAKAYGNHIYWFDSTSEQVQQQVEDAFFAGAKAMRDKVLADLVVIPEPEKKA